MKRLTHLLQEHQIGEWCKRAAWLVAGLGVLRIVLFLWAQYAYINNPNNSTVSILGTAYVLASTIQPVVGYLFYTVFFFFLLYAAGGLANYFLGTAEDMLPEEAEEEAEEEELS